MSCEPKEPSLLWVEIPARRDISWSRDLTFQVSPTRVMRPESVYAPPSLRFWMFQEGEITLTQILFATCIWRTALWISNVGQDTATAQGSSGTDHLLRPRILRVPRDPYKYYICSATQLSTPTHPDNTTHHFQSLNKVRFCSQISHAYGNWMTIHQKTK